MIIRKLEKKNHGSLRIILDEYKLHIGEEKITSEEYHRLRHAMEYDLITFFVAEEDGELIGMCSVSKYFTTYKASFTAIFEDFYIRPEYRGTGLARKMTDVVFSEMKKNGIVSVWVGCSDEDVPMYRNLGFKYKLGNLLSWLKK